jgi:hypothetical protein
MTSDRFSASTTASVGTIGHPNIHQCANQTAAGREVSKSRKKTVITAECSAAPMP